MQAFIDQPKRIPFFLKLGILLSERITGKVMLPARILAWYPKAAIGSGVMESLVAHADGDMTPRMLKLIRMTASYAAACPFCIDMNSYEYRDVGITDEEAESLRGDFEKIGAFSEREKLEIAYTRGIALQHWYPPGNKKRRSCKETSGRRLLFYPALSGQHSYSYMDRRRMDTSWRPSAAFSTSRPYKRGLCLRVGKNLKPEKYLKTAHAKRLHHPLYVLA